MGVGDPEPANFYSATVYRGIKHQEKKQGRRHTDLVSSIERLQLTELKGVIHLVGLNPFYVHNWTHQVDVYRAYCGMGASRISIESTRRIVRKIERLDKIKSRAIIFY